MTRQHTGDAAPHTHLRDATSHLANARRSLEAASPADPELASAAARRALDAALVDIGGPGRMTIAAWRSRPVPRRRSSFR